MITYSDTVRPSPLLNPLPPQSCSILITLTRVSVPADAVTSIRNFAGQERATTYPACSVSTTDPQLPPSGSGPTGSCICMYNLRTVATQVSRQLFTYSVAGKLSGQDLQCNIFFILTDLQHNIFFYPDWLTA